MPDRQHFISRIIFLFSVFSFVFAASCTSKFEEPGVNNDHSVGEVSDRRQNAELELEQQIEKIDEAVKKYRVLVNVVKVLLHAQSDIDPIEMLLSIHDQAREAWPTVDSNLNLVVQGHLKVDNFGSSEACRTIDYILKSNSGVLTYDFRTCYSTRWIPLLEMDSTGPMILKFHFKNLSQLVPLQDAFQEASGCELSEATNSRLKCNDLVIASNSDSLTTVDIVEVQDSYLLNVEIYSRLDQTLLRKGLATIMKTGEIRELKWTDL